MQLFDEEGVHEYITIINKKTMKYITKMLGVAFILIAAVSCKKSNDTGISLKFKATTTLPAGMKGVDVTGFTFSEAMLGIKHIEIKREDEMLNNGKMEYDFKDNYSVDLLTGTSTPDLGLADFVPGTYNKFESETAPVLASGKSVSVKGSYTNSLGTTYNFDFSSIEEFEFEFESSTGFVLAEGSVMDMLINVNLPSLFLGVDFSKATANVNGVIVINETTNNSISSLIKNNIDKVCEMKEEHMN